MRGYVEEIRPWRLGFTGLARATMEDWRALRVRPKGGRGFLTGSDSLPRLSLGYGRRLLSTIRPALGGSTCPFAACHAIGSTDSYDIARVDGLLDECALRICPGTPSDAVPGDCHRRAGPQLSSLVHNTIEDHNGIAVEPARIFVGQQTSVMTIQRPHVNRQYHCLCPRPLIIRLHVQIANRDNLQ